MVGGHFSPHRFLGQARQEQELICLQRLQNSRIVTQSVLEEPATRTRSRRFGLRVGLFEDAEGVAHFSLLDGCKGTKETNH